MAAVASHGLCQAQTAAAAVPEPQNRYFTRFSRSPPASSGCDSSYAIKAPAAGAATRAARASLPGPWAVCMLLWARPRSPIADPLLYLGPCRPHLPSPRYFADFPPMLRSYPLRARSAGPPQPRFRSYCGGRLRDRVFNAAVGLHPHAPGISRGLRDTHVYVGSTGYVG